MSEKIQKINELYAIIDSIREELNNNFISKDEHLTLQCELYDTEDQLRNLEIECFGCVRYNYP